MPSLGILFPLLVLALSYHAVSGVLPLDKCKAAKQLIEAKKQGVQLQGCFLRCFVCVMEHDGDYNTSKITPNGPGGTTKHGVFQIQSGAKNHCGLTLNEGLCQKQCKKFLDDNLLDDIVCAMKIQIKQGFQYWSGYMKHCSKSPTHLPDLSKCSLSREELAILESLENSATCAKNCPTSPTFFQDNDEDELTVPGVDEWDSIEELEQVFFPNGNL